MSLPLYSLLTFDLSSSQVVLMVKHLLVSAGDVLWFDAGSIPGLGRYPGKGDGNLLQYSCHIIPP